jgi:hypothetical protein
MADLFAVTAPLLIRYPDGYREVKVERLPHPDGLLYFKPFWDKLDPRQGLCVVSGQVRGEGPWKVGDAVVTVLGCHGTDAELATLFADWQAYREQLGTDYPDQDGLIAIARSSGYLP